MAYLIDSSKHVLEKIADALIEYETLDTADVDIIVAGGTLSRPPPAKPLATAVVEKRKAGFAEADEGAAVYGSEFLLREMISNLIDNAVRYTPAGGQVTLRVLPLGDFVLVEVADTGIGISAADAEMVFEPFYRVDDSHSEGSGLGLAIVRQIADMHRADVSLRPSNEGRGTVARAVFPALTQRAPVRIREGRARRRCYYQCW